MGPCLCRLINIRFQRDVFSVAKWQLLEMPLVTRAVIVQNLSIQIQEASSLQRSFIILTILSVLACPMKCASGACSSELAIRKSTTAAAPHSCRCCQHRNSPAKQSVPSAPEPLDCCPCQGVCAGAIVQKQQLELDSRLSSCEFCAVPMANIDAPLTEDFLPANFTQIAPAGCSGRSLRLHVCSLTC